MPAPTAPTLSEVERIASHVELSLTELLQKADEEIGRAAADVEKGESLSVSLEKSNVFPPTVTDMIAIGDEAGALDVVLEKVSVMLKIDKTNAVQHCPDQYPVIHLFSCYQCFLIVSETAVGVNIPVDKAQSAKHLTLPSDISNFGI